MKGSRLPPNKKRRRRGQLKRASDDEPISVLLTTSNSYATPPPRRPPRRRASTEADQKMIAWKEDLKNTPQSLLLTVKEGVIHDDKSLFKAFDFPRR
jgi:hypothetical protein